MYSLKFFYISMMVFLIHVALFVTGIFFIDSKQAPQIQTQAPRAIEVGIIGFQENKPSLQDKPPIQPIPHAQATRVQTLRQEPKQAVFTKTAHTIITDQGHETVQINSLPKNNIENNSATEINPKGTNHQSSNVTNALDKASTENKSEVNDKNITAQANQKILPSGNAAHLHNPKPPYPTASLRLQEQGTVILSVLVAANGSPKEVSIHKSSGYERLDEAALQTVKQHWRFIPGTVGGIAKDMPHLQPIIFNLDNL